MKEVRIWGNSGGILLPREWLGKQVRIELIDRSGDIKKEVLDILSPHLHDLLGMYLAGSYARGDQEKDSDIDIIAISRSTHKKIISGKYHVEILPLKNILTLLKKNPIQIVPRIKEAKPIINQGLLEELQALPLSSHPWKRYIQECKEAIKSSKNLIQYDKQKKNTLLSSDSVIYSTMLRLRGISLIQSITAEKKYSKKEFQKKTIKETGISEEEFYKAYEIYKHTRAGTNSQERVTLVTTEKLLFLLEKEVKTFETKKTA